ncbi:hypothetical protein AB1Y20_002870 [Prymnesium parvum]|uniref:Apple domain-containing protein n=1 Tax=Prymnesium parvum TaxID=97485 RepID=A0AB34JBM3_PRYPA
MACVQPRLLAPGALRAVPLPSDGTPAATPPPPPRPTDRAPPVAARRLACLESHFSDSPLAAADCLPRLPAGALPRRGSPPLDLQIHVPLDHSGAALTNPSVLCRAGRLLLAGRAILPVRVQPPCTDIWRSSTLLASLGYNHSSARLEPLGCVSDLTALSAEAYGDAGSDAAARCASRGVPPSVGLGGEDPRFFPLSSALYVAYNGAAPPRGEGCARLSRAMVLQRVDALAPPLPLRLDPSAASSDRNWLLFARGRAVHLVYSVQPHVILTLHGGGRCTRTHATSNGVFRRRFAGMAVHGGAHPLLLPSGRRYLSVFHTKDTALQYLNYAYTFDATPPFRVRSVGRRALRLHGRRVRFVSSLAWLGGGEEPWVGVAYGADDSEARLSVLRLEELLEDMEDVTATATDESNASAPAADAGASTPYDRAIRSPCADSQWLRLAHEAAGAGGEEREALGEMVVPPHNPSAWTSNEGRACSLAADARLDAPSIAVVAAAAPRLCCVACLKHELCHAFNWYAGTCYLKQWGGTATFRSGSVAGHFGAEAGCGCEARRGRLANGSRLATRAARSPRECCAECARAPRCSAWTWAPPAACELQHSPRAAEALSAAAADDDDDGAVSGRLALRRSVLFVHPQPPHLHLGCDRRLLGLVGMLQRDGWAVAFAGQSEYDPGPVHGKVELARMGVPLLAPALVDFAVEHAVSVVVVSLWFWSGETLPTRFLTTLRVELPHSKVVILSDDVHHKRVLLGEVKSGRGGRAASVKASRVKEEELASYFHADHVLTISEQDKMSILESLPDDKPMKAHRFSVLRHVYTDGVLFPLSERASFESRHGLLFVGNVNNPTNAHGLRWLLRFAWPALREQQPSLTLKIVGSLEGEEAHLTGLDQLLHAADGVTVVGYVDNLAELLQQARVFIVPIRWATGIITKQSIAHVHGLPTVITPVAARHLAPAPLDMLGNGRVWSHALGRYELARIAMIAERPLEYAAAVLHLYNNRTLWEEISQNGARYARSGGGGHGVCPTGLREDWRAFWQQLDRTVCARTFIDSL